MLNIYAFFFFKFHFFPLNFESPNFVYTRFINVPMNVFFTNSSDWLDVTCIVIMLEKGSGIAFAFGVFCLFLLSDSKL